MKKFLPILLVIATLVGWYAWLTKGDLTDVGALTDVFSTGDQYTAAEANRENLLSGKIVESYADLRALDDSTYTWIREGTKATILTDEIAGTFVYDADLETSDDGGVYIEAGDGCWVRQYTSPINAKWYATGDGTTDDYGAVDNLFIYMATLEEAAVYFPEGNYLLSSRVVQALQGKCEYTIYGDGPDSKIIVNNSDGGISLTAVSQATHVVLRDIAFCANLADSGTAFSYAVTPGGALEKRIFEAHNVHIGADDFFVGEEDQAFDIGLEATGMVWPLLQNVVFSVSHESTHTVSKGFNLDNTYGAMVLDCSIQTNGKTNPGTIAISNEGTTQETFYLKNSHIVHWGIGLNYVRSSQEPLLFIENNHFNCQGVAVNIDGASDIHASNNSFWPSSEADADYHDYEIINASVGLFNGDQFAMPGSTSRVHYYVAPTGAKFVQHLTFKNIKIDDYTASWASIVRIPAGASYIEVEIPDTIPVDVTYSDMIDNSAISTIITSSKSVRTYGNGATPSPFTRYRHSDSPANNDELNSTTHYGKNDADEWVDYVTEVNGIATAAGSVTDGSEDGRKRIYTKVDGSNVRQLQIDDGVNFRSVGAGPGSGKIDTDGYYLGGNELIDEDGCMPAGSLTAVTEATDYTEWPNTVVLADVGSTTRIGLPDCSTAEVGNWGEWKCKNTAEVQFYASEDSVNDVIRGTGTEDVGGGVYEYHTNGGTNESVRAICLENNVIYIDGSGEATFEGGSFDGNVSVGGDLTVTGDAEVLNLYTKDGVTNLKHPDFGVVGDAVLFTGDDATISSGDATLTCTTSRFASSDVGKTIYVLGAGAAGACLSTTIASYNSGTSIELTDNAGTNVTDADVLYGTDDTDAIQDSLDYAMAVRTSDASDPMQSTAVFIPQGKYLFSDTLFIDADHFKLFGGGEGVAEFVRGGDFGNSFEIQRPRETTPTGNLQYNITLDSFSVNSLIRPTSGSHFRIVANRFLNIKNVEIEGGACTGFQFVGCDQFYVQGVRFFGNEDLYSGYTPADGTGFFRFARNGSGETDYSSFDCSGTLRDCGMWIGSETPFYVAYDVQNADGIILDNCYARRSYYSNFRQKPMDANTMVGGVRAINCWSDYATTAGWIAEGTGEGIISTLISNCRFYGGSSIQSHGIVLNSSDIQNFQILSNQISHNKYEGIDVRSIDGGLDIKSNKIFHANTSDTAGIGAIQIDAGLSDFNIQNNALCGDGHGGVGTARTGVNIATGASDDYIVTMNNCNGCTFSAVADNGTGTDKIVSDNLAP